MGETLHRGNDYGTSTFTHEKVISHQKSIDSGLIGIFFLLLLLLEQFVKRCKLHFSLFLGVFCFVFLGISHWRISMMWWYDRMQVCAVYMCEFYSFISPSLRFNPAQQTAHFIASINNLLPIKTVIK